MYKWSRIHRPGIKATSLLALVAERLSGLAVACGPREKSKIKVRSSWSCLSRSTAGRLAGAS